MNLVSPCQVAIVRRNAGDLGGYAPAIRFNVSTGAVLNPAMQFLQIVQPALRVFKPVLQIDHIVEAKQGPSKARAHLLYVIELHVVEFVAAKDVFAGSGQFFAGCPKWIAYRGRNKRLIPDVIDLQHRLENTQRWRAV